MYIKERNSYKDESYLIDLAVNAFGVRTEIVQNVLKNTHKIIVFYDENYKAFGFLCYRFIVNDTVFIDYAVFDPKYQGKGVATRFLPSLKKIAKEKDVKVVTGFVSNNNPRAFNIFTSWGFKPILNLVDGVLIGTFII